MHADIHYAPPVIEVPLDERVAYLRRVGALTFAGLFVSLLTGAASTFVYAAFPVLLSGWFPMIIAFGCFAVAHYGAERVVMTADSQITKIAAFFVGTVFQGIAMGMILLVAAIVSSNVFGNPFVIVMQAFGIVGATAFSMMGWLMTGPKNLSMLRGALAVMWFPMLIAMVLTWAFPVGGLLGLGLSALFVVVSGAGLLYQLDAVIHRLSTTQHVEGAYEVTMALLVLLWNVLSLLSRLQSRN